MEGTLDARILAAAEADLERSTGEDYRLTDDDFGAAAREVVLSISAVLGDRI